MRGGGDAGGGYDKKGGPVFVRQVPKFLQGLVKPVDPEEDEKKINAKRMPQFNDDDDSDDGLGDFEEATIEGHVSEEILAMIAARKAKKKQAKEGKGAAGAESESKEGEKNKEAEEKKEEEEKPADLSQKVVFRKTEKRKADSSSTGPASKRKASSSTSSSSQKPANKALSFSYDEEEEEGS
eukprot:GILI01026656.1.p1 GENE.GILI01026656.1~~GILI01026656.1.p1  ORF type:complete len:182 (-),score=63.30 GILI01026656.1:55-600(-)